MDKREEIRNQVVEDVAAILDGNGHLLSCLHFKDFAQTKLLHELIWKYGHALPGGMGNKFQRNRWWSKAALEATGRTGEKSYATRAGKSLELEHVFSRKYICTKLRPNTKAHEVRGVFDTYVILCIVTKEEHARLAKDGKGEEGWARYEAAGIDREDWHLISPSR